MDEFIKAIVGVEEANPGLEPIAVLRSLRRAAGLMDRFIQLFLGKASSDGVVMEAGLSDYFGRALRHTVTEDGREEGVVLTSDGTTVALRPLLLGIEVGLLSKITGQCEGNGLHTLTLARDLALSFRDFQKSVTPQRLGPDGCWDSISTPTNFSLSGPISRMTTAMVNGGMDGVILGTEVSSANQSGGPAVKLSSLLSSYYCHRMDRDESDTAPLLVSQRRRENFQELDRGSNLARYVRNNMQDTFPNVVVDEGMEEFVHKYLG